MDDDSRKYIIDRIKSRKVSIHEFNFDRLYAPPLSIFFSYQDINDLRNIATSIKYSAKPEVRYKLIDEICTKRGMMKFGAGTNRVVYKHPEFQNILFKIAADNIGMKDNPDEFRNQFIVKPFVSKCFEVSPCGTVAVVERCNPIQSREEFISVADDIHEVILEWFIGEYVLADIGNKFFMNWGIREGFGPVLIDYPYLYKLDGSKIYCSKPDPQSQTGYCNGEIDYDDGFNFLVCKKCGAIYKAKELEMKINKKEIVIQKEGEMKEMKVTVSGGTKNLKKTTFVVGDEGNELFNPVISSIPPIVESNDEENVIIKKAVLNNNDNMESNISVTILEKNKGNDKVEVSEPEVEAEPVAEPEVKVVEPEPVKEEEDNKICYTNSDQPIYVNGVSSAKKTTSPISFTKEAKEEVVVEEEDSIDSIERDLLAVLDRVNNIKAPQNVINQLYERILNKITIIEGRVNTDYIIDILSNMMNLDANISDESVDKILVILSMISNRFNIDINVESAVNNNEYNVIDVTIKSIIESLDGNKSYIEATDEVSITNDMKEKDDECKGVCYYKLITSDIKDIYPDEDPYKLLVALNENGEYILDNDNFIIAFNEIDGYPISDGTVAHEPDSE